MTEDPIQFSHYAVGTSKNQFPMSDRDLITDTAYDTAAPSSDVAALQTIERTVVQMMDEKHPLIISTKRPYNDAIRMMCSETPIPSMLPAYRDAWHARAPGSETRMQALLGDTGIGKSFMAESIALTRDPRGAIIVHCHKGMDLSELLWETVLDLNVDKKLAFDQINERLESGKLHAASKGMLEAAMGDAYVDGKLRWEMLGYKGGKKTKEQLSADLEALNRVAQVEHMTGAGEMLFTLKKTHGPLIRAAIEGREVIIDEYEKTQRGSEVALYGLMHLLRGGKHGSEFTAHGGPGQEFTFRKDDLPEGFFVTLTGNFTHDGHQSRLLADSEAGRIQAVPIPKTTPEDMQHRICQIMTGVPISTFYYMRPKQWDANPSAFAKFLKNMHPAGKEGIPADQLAKIDHWQDTLKASALLTQYHTAVRRAVDTNWLLKQPALANIANEVTAELRKNMGAGDFNFIRNDIRYARSFTPKNTPPGFGEDIDVDGFFNNPISPPQHDEPIEIQYGNRLVARTLERITSVVDADQRPHLAAYLDRIARLTGMKPLEDSEVSAHPYHQLVADLLNHGINRSQTLNSRAESIQKIIAEMVRQKHSGLSDVDEDIVPIAVIEQRLSELHSEVLAPGTSVIVIPNTDGAPEKTYHDPLITVMVQDSVKVGKSVTIKPQNLLDLDTFIGAIAASDKDNELLNQIWTESMKHSDSIVTTPAVEIAEGVHSSGLAMTTVCCRTSRAGIDSVTPLHILINKTNGKTLIIGEGDTGKKLLEHKGITYINRNSTDATNEVEAAMRDLSSGNNADVLTAFKEAFTLRNKVDPAVLNEATTANAVANIFTDPTLSEPVMPVQITRIRHSEVTANDKYAGYRDMIAANRAKKESSQTTGI